MPPARELGPTERLNDGASALQVENEAPPRSGEAQRSTMGPPRMSKKTLVIRGAVGLFLLCFVIVLLHIYSGKGGLSYFFYGFECTAEQTLAGCTVCITKDDCEECIAGREKYQGEDLRVTCHFPCTDAQQTGRCTRCENSTACSACSEGYILKHEGDEIRCMFACSVPGTNAVIEDTRYAAGACIECLPKGKCAKCRDRYILDDLGQCLAPIDPELVEFYMYRAVSPESYPIDGVNMASAAGILSYLHVEVVSSTNVETAHPPQCERKYDIQKIQRWHVRMKNTPMVYNHDREYPKFAQFMQFDKGQCTSGYPTSTGDEFWRRYGYVVGCQSGDMKTFHYPNAHWYSLPGTCPMEDFNNKTHDDCNVKAPGGSCSDPDGTPFCTYEAKLDGEVTIDQLVGICDEPDCLGFKEFCMAGKKEFKCPDCDDDGLAIDFWKDYKNPERNKQRTNELEALFQKNFPNADKFELPLCDGW